MKNHNHNSILKYQLIMFLIMVIVGILFNPMNVLAYNFSHLYLSTTLVYGGVLMATNMMWAHELVHYFNNGHLNMFIFLLGIFLSIFVSIFLLRKQLFVTDREWLKRMISHHSTALTTSTYIYNKTNNKKVKELSKDILETQIKEIRLMKQLLKK